MHPDPTFFRLAAAERATSRSWVPNVDFFLTFWFVLSFDVCQTRWDQGGPDRVTTSDTRQQIKIKNVFSLHAGRLIFNQ